MPAWSALTTQLPTPWNVTLPPATEQTLLDAAAMLKLTVRPDVAVAATVYAAPPTVAAAGAVDVKLIVWLARPTPNDCCTCGAAAQFALPAWFALITQVPEPWKVTFVPAIAQTLLALASIEKLTGRPEFATAATVYGVPPICAEDGTLEVKLIVWLPWPTASATVRPPLQPAESVAVTVTR